MERQPPLAVQPGDNQCIHVSRSHVSPVVDVGVGDHHVSVDGDGQDVEDGHPEQPIPEMKI